MAAVLNNTQAAMSAGGWCKATSTTSNGIAAILESVSKFGRSVSIPRNVALRTGVREGCWRYLRSRRVDQCNCNQIAIVGPAPPDNLGVIRVYPGESSV